jgi:formylglycine-generating enzyme required for sulfatase activity
LNEKEGTDKYRLPSESEWEYSCRAGTQTAFSFGDDDTKLGDYAWYYDNSGGQTHPVGQKKPNRWGLYDMHGNIREWVQDNWHDHYVGAPLDGNAWEVGNSSRRVLRGGGWDAYARFCRSALRHKYVPDSLHSDLGFRLVRDI